MAENVVENAQEEAEAVVAEAEAITNSAAEVTETPSAPIVPELSAEELARREMNRREFLTYTWAGSLALVGAISSYATFAFLYPRFREGEFGGKFRQDPGLFSAEGAPGANPDGKFWMVTTTEGQPKAIYMVCTHLGCLYKWVGSNNRFECPCHGSKFSRDGFYIEGPAPRSLDSFETEVVDGQVVVGGQGEKGPDSDSVAGCDSDGAAVQV